jgi:hypothetical protein
VIREVAEKHSDVRQMRALGFCVTIPHAEFMARKFSAAGIPALAVSANFPDEERRTALHRLRDRDLNVLFAVDLFNEGIDVPEIDTVLFLRPTESATVFLPQLGRGLRRAEGKDCLTVLDFIGAQHRKFRFDARFRALLRGSGTGVARQIREDFPFLPSGCSMQLDRVSKEIVLQNVAHAVGATFQSLVTALRDIGRDVSLGEFLSEAEVDTDRLYRHGRTWSSLRREAGLSAPPPGPASEALGRGLSRIQHMDDPSWLRTIREFLERGPEHTTAVSEEALRILTGFSFTLFGPSSPGTLPEVLDHLSANPDIHTEVLELLGLHEEGLMGVVTPIGEVLGWPRPVPLSLHARYSLEEALAALGRSTLAARFKTQAGVLWVPAIQSDVFFVTLEKDETHYSPQTLYRDYAISSELFHWESQNTTRERSETGKRYVNHAERGSHVLLFARRTKDHRAYTFLGPMIYQGHHGERPMAITWKLLRPMPAEFFLEARVAAS